MKPFRDRLPEMFVFPGNTVHQLEGMAVFDEIVRDFHQFASELLHDRGSLLGRDRGRGPGPDRPQGHAAEADRVLARFAFDFDLYIDQFRPIHDTPAEFQRSAELDRLESAICLDDFDVCRFGHDLDVLDENDPTDHQGANRLPSDGNMLPLQGKSATSPGLQEMSSITSCAGRRDINGSCLIDQGQSLETHPVPIVRSPLPDFIVLQEGVSPINHQQGPGHISGCRTRQINS